MHAYLTDFLERINDLGARISQDFLVAERPRRHALNDHPVPAAWGASSCGEPHVHSRRPASRDPLSL